MRPVHPLNTQHGAKRSSSHVHHSWRARVPQAATTPSLTKPSPRSFPPARSCAAWGASMTQLQGGPLGTPLRRRAQPLVAALDVGGLLRLPLLRVLLALLAARGRERAPALPPRQGSLPRRARRRLATFLLLLLLAHRRRHRWKLPPRPRRVRSATRVRRLSRRRPLLGTARGRTEAADLPAPAVELLPPGVDDSCCRLELTTAASRLELTCRCFT